MTTSNKTPSTKSDQPPGSERARDEQREDGGPRYAGGDWQTADERAPDERFGRTRADAADVDEDGRPRDPGELTSNEASIDDDDEIPETNGPQEGVRRGNISRGKD